MKLCVLLVASFIYCCDRSPATTGEHASEVYGLRESFRYRTVVERAIGIANAILGSEVDVHFQPSWKTSQPPSIPVYVVDGEKLSPKHVVFVPTGCKCVIINSDSLDNELFGLFVPQSTTAGFEIAEVKREEILAFTLLHEAGHLHFGDSGSFVESGDVSLNEILAAKSNPETSLSRYAVAKHPELRADLFACDEIEKALKNPGDDRTEAALRMAFLLSDLKWNLQIIRSLDHFGAYAVGGTARKALFLDTSYSHPNLEFRLRVSSMIAETRPRTTVIDPMLEEFIKERSEQLVKDMPLWVNPGTHLRNP